MRWSRKGVATCSRTVRCGGARLSMAIDIRRRVFDPPIDLQQLHSSPWSGCDVVDGSVFGDEFWTR